MTDLDIRLNLSYLGPNLVDVASRGEHNLMKTVNRTELTEINEVFEKKKL